MYSNVSVCLWRWWWKDAEKGKIKIDKDGGKDASVFSKLRLICTRKVKNGRKIKQKANFL